MSREGGGGLRKALLISTAIHVTAGVLVWLFASQGQSLPPMRVYAVNIVSPPPQQQGPPSPEPQAPAEPEPVEEPEVEEPEPEPPEPEPEPAPTPAPPQRTPPRQDPPRAPQPTRDPDPEPEPQRPPQRSTGDQPDPNSPGGENINLQLQGVQCPTPEYCNNIIRQLYRYFRRPAGAIGVADVYFQINRDGSVSGLRLVSGTGPPAFRLAVMEAVEQAGINRAFGPLPSAYQADQLPVSFYFRPAR